MQTRTEKTSITSDDVLIVSIWILEILHVVALETGYTHHYVGQMHFGGCHEAYSW